jgi:hypothetical protein
MRRVLPFLVFALTALPATAQMVDVSGVGSAARESTGGYSTGESGASAWEMLSRLLFGGEEEDRPTPGASVMIRSFSDAQGAPCREYLRQVRLGNELVDASGVFCREPDGSWTLKK